MPDASARKSAAVALLAILLLRSVSSGILGLALPLYVAGSGHTAGQWGLAAGAWSLAMIFAEPFWGWVTDRRGTAAPLLVSTVGSALLVPILSLTGSLPLLVGVQLGRGAIEVAGAPSSRAALAHLLGPGRKATGIGLFQFVSGAGSIFGPLLGGWLLERWGYPATFCVCAGSSLLAAAVTLLSRRLLSGPLTGNAPSAPAGPSTLPHDPKASHHPLRAFAVLAVMAACLFAGTSAGRSFLPLLGTQTLGLSTGRVAGIVALATALTGPFTLLTAGLADRMGRRPLILGGALAVSAALLGYSRVQDYNGLLLCTLALSLGGAAAVPAGVAWVSDITQSGRQGRMIGLYGACEDLGITAGPLLCGLLWDARGPGAAFTVTAAVAAVAVVAALGLRSHRS